jgi:ribosomal protein S27E
MSRPKTASSDPLRLEFTPTVAVTTARSHNRYVSCPTCQRDTASYLFHNAGVRFVRCAGCGAVYVNPAREHPINNLDVDKLRPFANPRDRALMLSDMEALIEKVAADHQRIVGAPLERTVLLGRYLPEFAELAAAKRVGMSVAAIDDASFVKLAVDSDISWAKPLLARAPQVVILQELLESCSNPGEVLAALIAELPPTTLFVITYTNADSLPARMLRRRWAPFFETKSAYFNTDNLTALLARFGLVLKHQYPLPIKRTAQYVGDMAEKILPGLGLGRVAHWNPLRNAALPIRTGYRVAVFGRSQLAAARAEKLSIILPVFNEKRFAAQVIDAVLAKELPIDRELIIVESNSTDGTREIVAQYEGRPGVRVVYEDKPRGKGHAVRTGLQHVTGTIVLIQDSDFEYDIDDYDALLEPLLQRKTMFVLGSRSLGLDDWKVRKYDTTPIRGLALNFAQVMFAKTYNVLYQQRVTDVNTMFKVFRAECLDGLDLTSNGFELDIELACKLALNGNSPMEVPVNYVARGFDDGKKIRFWRDAIPSYFTFFRYRFR